MMEFKDINERKRKNISRIMTDCNFVHNFFAIRNKKPFLWIKKRYAIYKDIEIYTL